jgi:hypothetical protein
MTDFEDNTRQSGHTGSTAAELKARASEAASSVRQEAVHRAEGAKSAIADEMSDVARALRGATGDMRGNATSRRAVDWVADRLEGMSSAMRSRETSQLMNDVSSFARRNPALFIGGAALVGFAISRFAKASSQPRHEHWSGMDEDSAAASPSGPSGMTGEGAFAGGMDENTGFGNSNFNQAGRSDEGVAP